GSNAKATESLFNDLSDHCDFCFTQGKYGNVVGGWGATHDISGKIVIGGHYDGPSNSPGADDNASAIATLLELANQLKQYSPADVLIVLFNGEEHGLLGSKAFVKEIDDCKAAI